MPDINNDDGMAELYATDTEFAVQALNDVLAHGEPGEVLIALRQMTKAFGGVQAVAEKAELNPTQLYRTLSAEGNPTLSSLTSLLKAMGLQLMVGSVSTNQSRAGKGRGSSRSRAAAVLG